MTPPMDTVLSLRGLRASYEGAEVLSGIDLDVARGEVLAVLGRNGAGKTTLLHSVFNLGPSVEGEILVKGRSVVGWPTHRIARQGLALVPQGRGVFSTLTVQESLGLATLAAKADKSARWTMARVFEAFPRLAEKRRTASGALSGGERQMLALGRALLSQADVLLLDEPSEGLSPQSVEALLVGHIGLLAAEGMTVVLVEQNLALSLRVARRAVVLAEGRVCFDGPSATLAEDTALQHRLLGV